MIKAKVFGSEAQWNWQDGWTCKEPHTAAYLNAIQDCDISPELSVGDLFLEKGYSGKVWDLMLKQIPSAKLIELVPEEVPEEREGVVF